MSKDQKTGDTRGSESEAYAALVTLLVGCTWCLNLECPWSRACHSQLGGHPKKHEFGAQSEKWKEETSLRLLSSCPAAGGRCSILQDLLRRLPKQTLEVPAKAAITHRLPSPQVKVASQALKRPDCTPGFAEHLPTAGPSKVSEKPRTGIKKPRGGHVRMRLRVADQSYGGRRGRC